MEYGVSRSRAEGWSRSRKMELRLERGVGRQIDCALTLSRPAEVSWPERQDCFDREVFMSGHGESSGQVW
jgi:hypothetical protein